MKRLVEYLRPVFDCDCYVGALVYSPRGSHAHNAAGRVVGEFKNVEAAAAREAVTEQHSNGSVPAWSPVCARGEEAYSVAMLLTEQLAQFL